MEQNKHIVWMKNHKIMAAIALCVLLALIIVVWKNYQPMMSAYQVAKFEQEQAQALEKFRAEQMQDTMGGKTPQETLAMYIDAVEKGDYELASKYFAKEQRTNIIASFSNVSKADTQNILILLKQCLVQMNKGLESDPTIMGYSNSNDKEYSIARPILVKFVRYENGVWKIIEI